MLRPFVVLSTVMLLIVALLGTAIAAPQAEQGSLKIKRIDRSEYPEITLHLGLTSIEKDVDFKVLEDGREVKHVGVTSRAGKEPVAVTLIIDVSGSMGGKPLDDAKAAAKLFVEQARPDDQIAIISFSSAVDRLTDFTNDKKKLNKIITDLSAEGETAVFDALIAGLTASKERRLKNQSMILLSDGGDTASAKSGAEAADMAGKLKIPVSVVTLESEEFNPEPIAEVARRSGGHLLTAMSSEALEGLYNGLAAELHNRYQLVYTSKSKKAKVELEVEAAVGGKIMKASALLTGLPHAAPVDYKPPVAKPLAYVTSDALPWLPAVLGFAAAFLAVFAVSQLLLPSQNTLARQLKYYDQLQGRKTGQSPDERPLFEQAHESLIKLAGDLSVKYDFSGYAHQRLEQAGLPVKPQEYMVIHVLAVIATSLGAMFLTGSTFAGLLVMILVIICPLLAVEVLIARRKAAFNDQLPSTLDMLGGSMRAGFGLQQAVVAAGREAREPTSSELARVCNQVQMGMPLEDALDKMAARLGNPAFKWVVLAIAIHRETGGNLAEILDTLSETLRQRESMRRQISALTAEGRLSAIILIGLPFLEGSLLIWMNPKYMSTLVTTIPGIMMLFFALVLMGVGAVWLRSITQIDY